MRVGGGVLLDADVCMGIRKPTPKSFPAAPNCGWGVSPTPARFAYDPVLLAFVLLSVLLLLPPPPPPAVVRMLCAAFRNMRLAGSRGVCERLCSAVGDEAPMCDCAGGVSGESAAEMRCASARDTAWARSCSLWRFMCVLRLHFCVKRVLQTRHANGFSPVCTRM